MAARNDHKNTIRFQISGFIVGLMTTPTFVSSMMCGWVHREASWIFSTEIEWTTDLQSGGDQKRLVPHHPSSGRFINQS
jgi:hypothetical protein